MKTNEEQLKEIWNSPFFIAMCERPSRMNKLKYFIYKYLRIDLFGSQKVR